MEILTQPSKSKRHNYKEIKPNQSRNKWLFWLFMILLVVMADKFDDFIRQKTDGSYVIKSKRKQDVRKKKKKNNNTEQYALKATINGWYECYNCGIKKKIYLYIGEVWKYGVSKNGSTRYKKWWYRNKNLIYHSQYTGTYTKCLNQELDKILRYPILPENLKRTEKLPRPPGNKEDY